MESQQLSQYSPISHGSACASVTSKEVHTNQDPLDVSASKFDEYDKNSTKANSQKETKPVPTDVSENAHHASPHTAKAPLPQNGPYSQQCMMTPNQANPSGWPVYGHPYMMPYTPYQMSPMYYPPGSQHQYPQYTPYVGTPLSTPSPESGDKPTGPPSTKSNMTPVNESVKPPPILTSPDEFLNWVQYYIKFLQNSNLGDIIPRTDGTTTRDMTCNEHTFLYNTFQTFAPYQFLPAWVKDILKVDYTDMLKVLAKSIEKMQSDTQEVDDIRTLANLQYNGSTPVERFEAKVINAIERLRNNGIPINNKVACQLIMDGLYGEYKFLRYSSLNHPNITVTELLRNIHIVYKEQQKSKKSRHTDTKNPDGDRNSTYTSPKTTKTKFSSRNSKTSNRHKPRTVKANNVGTSHNSFDKNNDSINESPDQTIYLNNQYDLHLRPETY